MFYTTKLQSNNGYEASKRAIQKSLKECGLEYIDLYLIHSPLGGPKARADSWKAVCEAKADGKIHSIGVSNYGVKHLQEMVTSGFELPAVNQVRNHDCMLPFKYLMCIQIDLHPFMTRNDVVKYCREHEIALEVSTSFIQKNKNHLMYCRHGHLSPVDIGSDIRS